MIDWQPLLAGKVDGLGITVRGARVGDPVDALSLQDITHIFTKPARVRRNWSKDAAPIEPPGAVTQESRLGELRKHGGYVHAGTVVYEVTQGLIHKIWVRGALLNTLPFTAQADIERLLGHDRGCGRKHRGGTQGR